MYTIVVISRLVEIHLYSQYYGEHCYLKAARWNIKVRKSTEP
jgi:hypothetical protein